MRASVVVLLLAVPFAARAHHAVTDFGIARVEPSTRVTIETLAAGFELAERSGNWQALVLSGEVTAFTWLSVSARAPFARVSVGDTTHVGLADAEVAARARLYTTEHGGLILSAGLGVELPTGNSDHGLGGGHVELAPFVSGSAAPLEELVLFAAVAPLVSLGAHADEHDHPTAKPHIEGTATGLRGSVLAPHNPRELAVNAGAAYLVGPAFVSAGLGLAAPLGDHELSTFVSSRLEIGVRVASGLRLLAGAELPVAGDRRFDWKGRLELMWLP